MRPFVYSDRYRFTYDERSHADRMLGGHADEDLTIGDMKRTMAEDGFALTFKFRKINDELRAAAFLSSVEPPACIFQRHDTLDSEDEIWRAMYYRFVEMQLGFWKAKRTV